MLPRPNSKAIDRKRRLTYPAAALPNRGPSERVRDFAEVRIPLSPELAISEAARCIQCPSEPCVKACPVGNDIPYALWHLEHGRFDDAGRIFCQTNSMPDICGRVCPQSELCEGVCPYTKQGRPPVPIGRLEAFAASHAAIPLPDPAAIPADAHRAAVVGAGPAGLTVARELALLGHRVTVFDAWPAGGGVLRYGIPGFKMDHGLAQNMTEWLDAAGVEFVYGTVVGASPSLADLFDDGFETVFLGIGAGLGRGIDLPGSDLDGIHTATPYLVRANVEPALLPESLSGGPWTGRRVVVIGGGDTAMDCLRTAVRLGAEQATCLYRRTEAEMPGNERDRALAREEGVEFRWLVQPVRFIGESGRVIGVECTGMVLGEAGADGRRRPVPAPDSTFNVPTDRVVLALGYDPDPAIGGEEPQVQTGVGGLFVVCDQTGETTLSGVFAGGDAVTGPALVVTAVAHGLRAAAAMHEHMIRSTRSSREACRV
jgi:glutamate synthase (NADPH/NADH) small chain